MRGGHINLRPGVGVLLDTRLALPLLTSCSMCTTGASADKTELWLASAFVPR